MMAYYGKLETEFGGTGTGGSFHYSMTDIWADHNDRLSHNDIKHLSFK